MASCDGAVFSVSSGLSAAVAARALCNDLEAPCLRDTGGGVLRVDIVIIVFFLDLFTFVSGPPTRLRHCSAGDRRGRKTPSGGSRTPGKRCSVSKAILHPKPGCASLIGINRGGSVTAERSTLHCRAEVWHFRAADRRGCPGMPLGGGSPGCNHFPLPASCFLE